MLEVEYYKPNARTLINCLTSEYQWMEFLKNKDKEYEPLLDYLIYWGKQNELDVKYDKIRYQARKISEVTGIKPTKIKKLLNYIYEDILELNFSNPELFDNGALYHYVLHFRHYSYIYSNFNIWLPVPLNRLETFDFSFISAKLNIGHFWVSDIKYRHEYGKISVDVSMRAGYPNRYRELLLAKAEYMGEISFLEKYRLYDFQMDEKLKEYSKREKL